MPGLRAGQGWRAGAWVEVRTRAEIEASLDADGRLGGLPFMPEMARHAGRRYRVRQRAERTCVHPPQRPFPHLSDCVTLADLRCDGSAHGDCELGCRFFWKTTWLRPVAGPDSGSGGNGGSGDGRSPASAARSGPDPDPDPETPSALLARTAADGNGGYRCQGTDLVAATTPGPPLLSPWQYLGFLRDRTFTPGELVSMVVRMGLRKVASVLRSPVPPARRAPDRLEPGDWVRVRSREQIRGTLDPSGRLNGLAFGGDMAEECGKVLQVNRRVQRLLDERTGRIRSVRDTVLLRGSVCDRYLGCARGMPILWREAWLERLDEQANVPGSESRADRAEQA